MEGEISTFLCDKTICALSMGNTLSVYCKAFFYTNFNGNTRRRTLNASIHKTRRNISPQRIISQQYPSLRLMLVGSCLIFPCVQHLVKYSLIWPKISEKIYHFTSWNTVKDYDLQDAIDKNPVSCNSHLWKVPIPLAFEEVKRNPNTNENLPSISVVSFWRERGEETTEQKHTTYMHLKWWEDFTFLPRKRKTCM